MIRLVVGLGNPGQKYRHTPHNIGFGAADLLASRHGGQWRENRRFQADLATAEIAGRAIVLMEPRTFMNLSGDAVGRLVRYRAMSPEEILVACDDIDLPMGRLRLRPGGGAGGHKGLGSIIDALESNEFARLRIGIHPGEAVEDLTDYVLTPWWGETRDAMERVCAHAADAIERVVEAGLSEAMNEYNGRFFLETPEASPDGG